MELFFHFEFPQFVLDKCNHNNELECVVLVVAVAKWVCHFRRQRLLVNCDNQVTVSCVNSGVSHNKVIQSCLRYLHKIMALESFEIRTVYLASEQNRNVDNLSRWHLDEHHHCEFSHFARERDMTEVRVESQDFHFLL